MNKTLLVGILIVIIFVLIVIFPFYKNSKPVENFSIISHPDPLMQIHDDFINTKSNKSYNLNTNINLLNDIISENFNTESKDTADKLKIKFYKLVFDTIYEKLTHFIQKTPEYCNIHNKNDSCNLYVIVLQFLNFEFKNVFNNVSESDTKSKEPTKSITTLASTESVNPSQTSNTNQTTSSMETFLNSSEATSSVEVDSIKQNIQTLIKIDERDTSSENQSKLAKFKEIRQICDNFLNKIFNTNFTNYPKFKQTEEIKKVTERILTTIYFKVFPYSQSALACPLYSSDSCPSVPFNSAKQFNDESLKTEELPESILSRYKCKIDNSFGEKSNLCVNNHNNKFITTDCEVMNGYGKIMCENTNQKNKLNEIKQCKYENLTQKCVNPDKNNTDTNIDYLNTSQNKYGKYSKLVKDGSKCHLIYNNDIDSMKEMCESQDCNFMKVNTNIDGSIGYDYHGLCYAKNKDDRPENFCLGLNNLTAMDNDDTIKLNNLINESKCNRNYYTSGSGTSLLLSDDKSIDNVECHNIDTSNHKINILTDNYEPKNNKEYGFIIGRENRKNICEKLETNLGTSKCKFVEYQKYIPGDHKSKYAKLDMCIPIDSKNIPNDIVTKKEDCNSNLGNYWSEKNKKCVKVDCGCNSIKYKAVCNYHDGCLWQDTDPSASLDKNSKENGYENGYCRDMRHSFNKMENLLDRIHNKHVEQAVNVSQLEAQLGKTVPEFNNILSSLNS